VALIYKKNTEAKGDRLELDFPKTKKCAVKVLFKRLIEAIRLR
jgi:hypothetical protein